MLIGYFINTNIRILALSPIFWEHITEKFFLIKNMLYMGNTTLMMKKYQNITETLTKQPFLQENES